MIEFILNDQTINTDLPPGMTLLDFVRYNENQKGTKIGCREGDCGACTVLIGTLMENSVEYRTMTSCLTPLANANAKHVVTVEGINPADGSLTPIQRALVDENGTQCGFCTVGFVMSLTGFCIDKTEKTVEMSVSSIDGNICRCTGYKSIERAAEKICERLSGPASQNAEDSAGHNWLDSAIADRTVPEYFSGIKERLAALRADVTSPAIRNSASVVAGGTDLYVQQHDEMMRSDSVPLFDDSELHGIEEVDGFVEIGGSATVTDLVESELMQGIFPNLFKHLKLVSSTPIRNMATIAGNLVNASPIGDMTVWFLALNADILLSTPDGSDRTLPLKDLYVGYKDLARIETEVLRTIRFRKPAGNFYFNFEKVCKRTYLDIATVNTAISLLVEGDYIKEIHVAAGGVAPIPFYLRKTSDFLIGKKISGENVSRANEIMQQEISPISDVRGSKAYKRLLLRQLFSAHFFELFGLEPESAD